MTLFDSIMITLGLAFIAVVWGFFYRIGTEIANYIISVWYAVKTEENDYEDQPQQQNA